MGRKSLNLQEFFHSWSYHRRVAAERLPHAFKKRFFGDLEGKENERGEIEILIPMGGTHIRSGTRDRDDRFPQEKKGYILHELEKGVAEEGGLLGKKNVLFPHRCSRSRSPGEMRLTHKKQIKEQKRTLSPLGSHAPSRNPEIPQGKHKFRASGEKRTHWEGGTLNISIVLPMKSRGKAPIGEKIRSRKKNNQESS